MQVQRTMEAAQHEFRLRMVDLEQQYVRLKPDIDAALAAAVAGSRYIKGPEVGLFAQELGAALGGIDVLPCGNGTDALQLALMALELQPGDEVITTAFSFAATAEVIALLGLKPVFADIDPQTFNIDPASVAALIGPRTRVLLPVHLFGQAADMEALMELAEAHQLWVVEDVAQALGATCRFRGREQALGTIGHIGCTSFFPSKNLGGFGDGGACYTRQAHLAQRIRSLATHGSEQQYLHTRIGINSRLDTLQAAILRVKLPHLNDFIARRRAVAAVYQQELGHCPLLTLPLEQSGAMHSYNQYTLRVARGERAALQERLAAAGIPSRVYYPLALHQQPAFAPLAGQVELPNAEAASREVLSLPMHTEMLPGEAAYIARIVRRCAEECALNPSL